MKSITMTYIEDLEKRLKRKKDELLTIKQRYLELKSEIREFEICLDLAKVMFDDEKR